MEQLVNEIIRTSILEYPIALGFEPQTIGLKLFKVWMNHPTKQPMLGFHSGDIAYSIVTECSTREYPNKIKWSRFRIYCMLTPAQLHHPHDRHQLHSRMHERITIRSHQTLTPPKKRDSKKYAAPEKPHQIAISGP